MTSKEIQEKIKDIEAQKWDDITKLRCLQDDIHRTQIRIKCDLREFNRGRSVDSIDFMAYCPKCNTFYPGKMGHKECPK